MTWRDDPVAQSVHHRLRRIAADRREDFNALLVLYANERFLYRLSRTRHSRRFVLKGAMMFIVWLNRLHRPTRDLDLLGIGEITEATLRKIFTQVCEARVKADGLTFDPASIVVQEIRENQVYQGLRVKLRGRLGNARIDIQVDVGTGDTITPNPIEADYPTLLELPAPRLRTYPIETVVAEKLDAMVQLGLRNSRMRDFFDLWLMSRSFDFDGPVLAEAIQRTFARRGTALATEPTCFTDAFAQDASKNTQWHAFLRRSRLSDTPTAFAQVVDQVRTFLQPVIVALVEGRRVPQRWRPGGPWQPRA